MSPRPILPVSLYLDDRTVLLVGAGALADDRRARVEAAGASVRTVAPAEYEPDMCADVFLVLAVSGDPAFDRQVATDARRRGRLVYAHDQPAVSDLAMPAVARRGPLSLAVATDGSAPALARRLREELDRLLLLAGPRLDAILLSLGRAREELAPGRRAEVLYRMACRVRLTGSLEVDDERGP
jgi:siroheme synthase (precorrin-2 oxidase/ferrochelatase)